MRQDESEKTGQTRNFRRNFHVFVNAEVKLNFQLAEVSALEQGRVQETVWVCGKKMRVRKEGEVKGTKPIEKKNEE